MSTRIILIIRAEAVLALQTDLTYYNRIVFQGSIAAVVNACGVIPALIQMEAT